MKRVIRADNDAEVIEIEIKVNFSNQESVLSTDVLPVLKEDGMLDDQALANYQSFIMNACEIFDYYGFQMLSSYESGSYPHTSKYYWMAYAEDAEAGNVPLMIKVRISDHTQNFGPRFTQELKRRNKEEADKLKLPKDKQKQRYRLKDIVINNDTYNTYEDALNAIDDEVHTWLEMLDVDMSDFPEPLGKW